MSVVLLTGMSGTGKSTLLKHLKDDGNVTVDLDYGGWLIYHDDSGEYILDVARVIELIRSRSEENIFLAGTAVNQGQIYPYLDAVVTLTAPLHVMKERIMQRTDNPFGRSDSEWRKIVQDKEDFEALIIKGSDLTIDTTQPFPDTIDEIYRYIK